MPRRPPHECSRPGCHSLTTSRFCDGHAKADRQRVDAARGTSTQRGYGAAWQRIRRSWLAENPLCVTCNDNGRIVSATVVDHIVPMARGGPNDSSNYQSLCARCHNVKTAKHDGAFGR